MYSPPRTTRHNLRLFIQSVFPGAYEYASGTFYIQSTRGISWVLYCFLGNCLLFI